MPFRKLVIARFCLLLWLGCAQGLQAQNLVSVGTGLPSIESSPISIAGFNYDRLLDASDPAESSSLDASEAEGSGGYIRPAPAPTKKQFKVHAFSTLALSLRSNTLGPGADLATPLSGGFNLRVGANFMDFGYGFNIDGVNYSSKLHFLSGQMSLDWFPTHRGFHISPGVMYGKNSLSAASWVPAGKYFELGSQGFTNSVDDPLNGIASVVLPRKIAPMLTIGFRNIIPRSGGHLTFPVEFGAAYTGAPRIDVTLDGTACTKQGCFTFSQNQEAQASLQAEIQKLNETLKRLPVYPIISSGVALRF